MFSTGKQWAKPQALSSSLLMRTVLMVCVSWWKKRRKLKTTYLLAYKARHLKIFSSLIPLWRMKIKWFVTRATTITYGSLTKTRRSVSDQPCMATMKQTTNISTVLCFPNGLKRDKIGSKILICRLLYVWPKISLTMLQSSADGLCSLCWLRPKRCVLLLSSEPTQMASSTKQ